MNEVNGFGKEKRISNYGVQSDVFLTGISRRSMYWYM